MNLRHLLMVGLAGAAVVLAATPASFAQDEGLPISNGLNDRLEHIERQLKEVRDIVLQARATGKPVEIKEAGPDPEVAALSSKFDDIDQTLRTLNGQVDSLTHDLAQARKDAADAKDQNAALNDRLTKLEQQVASLAAPPPPPPGSAAGPAGAGPSDAGAAPADPKTAYANARQLLLSGDYASASAAFQDYVDHYGSSAEAPAARYWLGETKYVQNDYAGAAAAYIAAIHGWPKTSWAPDAVVKLSLSLLSLGKQSDACAALGEFDRHYAATANAAAKARSEAARIKAKCSG